MNKKIGYDICFFVYSFCVRKFINLDIASDLDNTLQL